jgi:hypothetical protein
MKVEIGMRLSKQQTAKINRPPEEREREREKHRTPFFPVALRRSPFCQHLHLELAAYRTVRK